MALFQKVKSSSHLKNGKYIIEAVDCKPEEVAAAFAYLMQQTNPLPSQDIETPKAESSESGKYRGQRSSRSSGRAAGRGRRSSGHSAKLSSKKNVPSKRLSPIESVLRNAKSGKSKS